MRCTLLGLLAATACQFDTATPVGAVPGGRDAAADADPAAPDASAAELDAGDTLQPDASTAIECDDWERQPAHFDPCVDIDVITDSLALSESGDYAYDTDLGTLTSPGNAPVAHTSVVLGAGDDAPRVIVAGDITIGPDAVLRATGNRPLIVVSWLNFTVSGTIDVGSDADSGAGANSSDCLAAEPGGDDTNGGGGGGGGGFGAAGGAGAEAREGGAALGGDGGDAAVAPTFRGGCPGGKGGAGESDIGGVAGAGGGAALLVTRNTLTINGTITSGGAGGGGSAGDRSGGAGGGSGGMIELEAASLQLISGAIVTANGGGGGGGSNQNTGDPGQPGQASDVAAIGGDGEGNGTEADGGAGGVLGATDGLPGTTSGRGGGGGGGGVGVIRFSANAMSSVNALVSPPEDT